MSDPLNQHQPAAPAQAQQPQQPVSPETFNNVPQGQQVQYVVAKKSLEGVGGWLAFWVVLAGLGGLGYIASALDGDSATALSTPAPLAMLLGVALFATAVLIAMRKAIGKLVAIGTIAASGLITIGTTLSDGADNAATVIIVNALFAGLVALYFMQSERVKQTLTK